jgi:secreted PhoX family phosphatase
VINSGNPEDAQQTVAEFTADQLAAGTQTDPNQTLIVADTANTGALNAPSSITFDANGNLWVAFALGGTDNAGGVEEIAASNLTGSGTSTTSPSVTLSSAAFVSTKAFGTLASFANPAGLAFDSAGDLWVANQSSQTGQGKRLGDGSIVEFTPSQLTASGSPVPVRGILANKNETNLGAPIYITFGPPLP